jgi:hypothetical protein
MPDAHALDEPGRKPSHPRFTGTPALDLGLPNAIKHSVAAVIPVSPYRSIRAFFWATGLLPGG